MQISFDQKSVLSNDMTQMEFKFFSEKASCKTTSLLDVYGKEPVRIQPYLDKNNYLLVKYSLLSPLLDSDNLIELILNRTSFGLTMNSEIFQTTNISKKQGELIYGPLADNYGYSFNLKSCDVKYGDCISSLPVYYSLSKKPPQNVSGLTFDLIDSRFVVLKWKKPSISNDFFLSYKIFRRQACNESLNPNELVTEKSESTVNCSGIIFKKKKVLSVVVKTIIIQLKRIKNAVVVKYIQLYQVINVVVIFTIYMFQLGKFAALLSLKILA